MTIRRLIAGTAVTGFVLFGLMSVLDTAIGTLSKNGLAVMAHALPLSLIDCVVLILAVAVLCGIYRKTRPRAPDAGPGLTDQMPA